MSSLLKTLQSFEGYLQISGFIEDLTVTNQVDMWEITYWPLVFSFGFRFPDVFQFLTRENL